MAKRRRPGHAYFAGAPLLMAHRGGSLLAPENTMAAFRNAVDRYDADVLEMDVRLTRDGRVVVIHDATVDRTTDGTGPVSQATWAQLAELDAGHRFRDLQGNHAFRGTGVRVPLFEEVLDAFPHTRLNVESKAAEAAGPLVELIRAFDAEHRVLVAAEFERTRRGARGYDGPWGASRSQVAAAWFRQRTGLAVGGVPGTDALQVPETWGRLRIVTPEFVRVAHDMNLPVHVWTVDRAEDMRRLLDWGVDGIQSDRPDVLAGVLHDVAGRPLPPGRGSVGK